MQSSFAPRLGSSPASEFGGLTAEHDILVYLYSRPGFLISRVDQIAEALFESSPAGASITLLQMTVLAVVFRLGEQDQATLAKWTGLDVSTTALVIANLLKAKYVQRRASEIDRRCKLISMTELGGSVLDAARTAVMRHDERLLRSGRIPRVRHVALMRRLMSAATGDRWVLSPPIELRRMWESTGFLNRRILQIYEAIFTAEAAQFDLTVRQFGALLAILAHPGLSQAAVGQIIGVSRTNTAMVVGNLVRKGLVSEEVDPADRRRKRYVITPDGTARAWDSIPAMARTEARLLAPLDADERRELERALGHMVLANNGLLSVPLFGLMEAISDPRWPVPSDALRQGVGAPFLVND